MTNNLYSETKLKLIKKLASFDSVAQQNDPADFGCANFTTCSYRPAIDLYYIPGKGYYSFQKEGSWSPVGQGGFLWDTDAGAEGNLRGWGDLVGGTVGSTLGFAGGAALGTSVAPGAGTVAGGMAGGVGGSIVGKGIGKNVFGTLGRGIDWATGHKATEQEKANRGVLKAFTPDGYDLLGAVPAVGRLATGVLKAGAKSGTQTAAKGMLRDSKYILNPSSWKETAQLRNWNPLSSKANMANPVYRAAYARQSVPALLGVEFGSRYAIANTVGIPERRFGGYVPDEALHANLGAPAGQIPHTPLPSNSDYQFNAPFGPGYHNTQGYTNVVGNQGTHLR